MLAQLKSRLAQLFDRIFVEENTEFLERTIIWLAVLGFGAHIGLVSLARWLDGSIGVFGYIGTSYLSTLYTPFSFILFYEVLLLILSIPKSTTESVGRQYEIISLIVIRNVFKDIADFGSFKIIEEQNAEFVDVLVDMGGGLVMFLFVAIFYHVRKYARTETVSVPDAALSTFIERKKAVALLLAGLLFALAAYNLFRWSTDVYRVVATGAAPTVDIKTIFYIDFFSVMIFTDVLILLLSMLRADDYQLVFRNAGFIISTILIRFSLTIKKPYDVELALLAMVFGTLVLLVYVYFRRITASTPVLTKPRAPDR